jgi:putative ABC transport system ATP-binding protein
MGSPSIVNSSPALLQLDNVSRTFTMGEVPVHALQEVSMTMKRAEFLVVVGPSGSGKTTLLNLLGGLDVPTEGRIEFDGKDLHDFNSRELTAYRRFSVGFVFQFYNLVPTLTAEENVRIAAELVENPMDVREALERVDLLDRATHFPAQMSGGEQQRVAVARAIVKRPPLLLCDEPTGALDFATGKLMLRRLIDLRDDLGMSVIVITHNSALADAADRVVRLRSGRIVEEHENATPKPPEDIVW